MNVLRSLRKLFRFNICSAWNGRSNASQREPERAREKGRAREEERERARAMQRKIQTKKTKNEDVENDKNDRRGKQNKSCDSRLFILCVFLELYYFDISASFQMFVFCFYCIAVNSDRNVVIQWIKYILCRCLIFMPVCTTDDVQSNRTDR